MPRFAQVRHEEWIAAPARAVRAQFADLQHHIDARVHAKLTLRVIEARPDGARYEQVVRLLGLPQRDIFERSFGAGGTMTDRSVEGFNRGGSLHFSFREEVRGGRAGTTVVISVSLPLPPVVGVLLRPLLERQIRAEVAAAAAEDKRDLETGAWARRHAETMLAAA